MQISTRRTRADWTGAISAGVQAESALYGGKGAAWVHALLANPGMAISL